MRDQRPAQAKRCCATLQPDQLAPHCRKHADKRASLNLLETTYAGTDGVLGVGQKNLRTIVMRAVEEAALRKSGSDNALEVEKCITTDDEGLPLPRTQKTS